MSAPAVSTQRRRRAMVGVGVGVALVALGACWSLASPLGASPDDDFHLATIWCSPTAPDDKCVDTGQRPFPKQIEVLVPRIIAQSFVDCYYGNPTISGACQPPTDVWDVPTVSRADDDSYPGGYHALFGFFVTDRPVLSVLSMRFVAWTLSVGLMVASVLVADPGLRRSFAVAAVIGSVPMAIFLFASNNPSGMAIAGVFSFVCGALAALRLESARRRIAAIAVATIGIVFALMSRNDSAVYIAASSAMVATLSWRRLRAQPRLLVLPVGAALVSVAALVVSGAADIARQGLEPAEFERQTFELVYENVVGFAQLLTGPAGTWGLGWGEILMPPLVTATMVGVVGAAFLRGIADSWAEKWIALALAGLVVTVIPFAVLLAGEEFVGEDVQPRYLLPMLLVLLAVALLQRPDAAIDLFTRPQRIVVALALTVAHSAALHGVIRRFVTGVGVRDFNLDRATEWWWTNGPSPTLVWFIGSVAFAGCATFVVFTCGRTATPLRRS